MKKILSIAAACLLLQACGSANKEQSKLDSINWILGFWEMSSPEGTVTESWIRTSDSTYSGIGKYIDSAGTVLSSEEIQIVLRDNKLLYIPVVSNQNNGAPTIFTEVGFSDTLIVFENKEHDFPTRITYHKKPGDSLLAFIEGDINGEQQRIDYPYTKK